MKDEMGQEAGMLRLPPWRQLQSRTIIALVLFCISLIISCRTSHEDMCPFDLSREGFIQEMVFPEATPRTSAFDAYTRGSYIIGKIDLMHGVRARKASKSPEIIGLIIVGPSGFWSFDVLLMIKKTDVVQLNWIRMPHARITLKGTKEISLAEFEIFRSQIINIDGLTPLLPKPYNTELERYDVEYGFGILAAFWDSGEHLLQYERCWDGPENETTKQFALTMDTILTNLVWTYGNELDENEPIYKPCEP